MKNSRVRWLWIAFAMLLVAALSVPFAAPGTSQAGMFSKAIVKLYSNGQVVGTWEASDQGKVEGDSLLFSVGENKMVRISGTYSVETIK